MSKQFTVVNITAEGAQMTSSGFDSYAAVIRSIKERLRYASNYVEFVIVSTNDKGRTSIETIAREDAERYCATFVG